MTTTRTMTAIGAHARRTFRRRTTSLASHPVDGGGVDRHCLRTITYNPNNSNDQRPHPQHQRGRRYLSALTNSSAGGTGRGEHTDEGTGSTLGLGLGSVSMDELLALASCQPTALSLEAMYRYAPKRRAKGDRDNNGGGGKKYVDVDRLRNAQFLHRELPIRVAQRAVDLLTLPHGLNRTREVQSIANTYLHYLQKLRDFPVPTNAESEREFTKMLNEFILDRHSIPMAISRGLGSLKDERKAPVDGRRLSEMEDALNRFFTARVGLRFLVEHHVLSGNEENSDDLYRRQLEAEGTAFLADRQEERDYEASEDASCGAIQKDCDPVKEVRRTVARVTQLCRESYGISPEIEIVVATPDKGEGVSFTYVPHHLRYMLAELLKNSCRATVRSYLSGVSTQKEDHTKHHNDSAGGIHDAPSLPPVRVVVTKGTEDVTIKVCDRGGGMKRSMMKQMWTFAHSTLNEEGRTREDKYDFGKDEFVGSHIRGFGLPLARIYARYFGGEVTIKSMEGYGVDAYLYLPVLGVACENLPQRVIRSPGNLDSSPPPNVPADGGADDVMIIDSYISKEDFYEDSNVRQFDPSSGGPTTMKMNNSVLDTLDERAL
ncbi:hypothetical protein ACHAW5_011021 [Stephanodiscus triporus]|uniref:Protein-serine/threonine kinase n=1 Tax=Stephanodiscus triporus TaxID=2934178 RepID=A0ABD3NMB0_9STRA